MVTGPGAPSPMSRPSTLVTGITPPAVLETKTSCAAYVRSRDRRSLGQNHGHTAARGAVGGVANGEAGHVGDQIARPGTDHRTAPPGY